MLGSNYIRMLDPKDLRTEPDIQLPFHGLQTPAQSYANYPSLLQSISLQNTAPHPQSFTKEAPHVITSNASTPPIATPPLATPPTATPYVITPNASTPSTATPPVVEEVHDDDEDSDDEGRNACDDIQGLLQQLDKMEDKGCRITEVTHVVNKWMIQGVVVPMKHHGVIFKVSGPCYLRIHLVREGLAWKMYETFPELPGTTCYTKTYYVDTSVSVLRKHCAETAPWSWPSNDCEKWAHHAIRATGVEESLYKTMKPPRLYPRMKDVYKLWNPGHHSVHGRKLAGKNWNNHESSSQTQPLRCT